MSTLVKMAENVERNWSIGFEGSVIERRGGAVTACQ